MAATTTALLGTEKGFRVDFRIPRDSDVKRDRKSRLLSAVAVGAIMVLTPAWFCAYAGSLVDPTVAHVGYKLGMYAGSLSYLGVFSKRILMYNPEYAGYVTQNPFPHLLNFVDKGQDQDDGMETYGAGPSLTHVWEQRNREGTYSLKITTQVIVVTVPTKTSSVKVTVAFEYVDDICHLDRAIGADNETVITGYHGYIAAFLTQQLTQVDASDAAKMDEALNTALSEEFMFTSDKSGRVFSKFETQYGVRTISILVSEIKLPKDVQTTRDAIEEGKQVHKIVAAMLGIEPDVLTQRENDGKIDPKVALELRKEALAMSKNATLTYVDVGGTSNPIAVIGSDTRSVGHH